VSVWKDYIDYMFMYLPFMASEMLVISKMRGPNLLKDSTHKTTSYFVNALFELYLFARYCI